MFKSKFMAILIPMFLLSTLAWIFCKYGEGNEFQTLRENLVYLVRDFFWKEGFSFFLKQMQLAVIKP